jgi:protease I
MTYKVLEGEKVAFLLTNGFEDSELAEPWKKVVDAGATGVIIAPESGVVTGKRGYQATVDVPVDWARASLFDALVIPGGRINVGQLRKNEYAVGFVRDFFEADKPVAAICHGGWLLAAADVVQGRTLTSYPDIQEDMRQAGATWVDREVVVDGRLITSRTPADLPAFIAALVNAIKED